jgi:OOP family OmpA-OmpF porin
MGSNFNPQDEFSKHLFKAYKEKAQFEAKEMHDWNSAKLYSEKAIKAAKGHKILPQDISYWKIKEDEIQSISKIRLDLIKAFNNLMIVYNDALLLDPFNLAKGISSLDCWSEQQEENWQIWDIEKCRKDYFDAMHEIYNIIAKNQKEEMENINSDSNKKNNIISSDSASIVTQNNEAKVLQIIYFDFDKSRLSNVSVNKINKFIKKNENIIDEFIIVGHTDTKGTKDYNHKLSLKRAESVKLILINLGIRSEKIKTLGRGENDLRVITEDEVAHPANRRAEISPLK